MYKKYVIIFLHLSFGLAFSDCIRLDYQEEELWSGNNTFSPFLVFAIYVCLVQLQDMLENVR